MDHDVIEALREAGSGRDTVGVDLDRVIARGRIRRRRRRWVQAGSATLATAAVLVTAIGLGHAGVSSRPTGDGDQVATTHSSKQHRDQGSAIDWGACTKGDFSSRHDLIHSGLAPYWLHLRDAVDPTAQHLACNSSMGGSPGQGMHFGGYYTIGHQTSDIRLGAFDATDDGGQYAETYVPLPCGAGSELFYGDLTCESVPAPAGGDLVYGQLDGPNGPTRVASYTAPDGKTVVFMYTPDVDFSNINGAEPMTTTPVTREQALSIVTDPFYRRW